MWRAWWRREGVDVGYACRGTAGEGGSGWVVGWMEGGERETRHAKCLNQNVGMRGAAYACSPMHSRRVPIATQPSFGTTAHTINQAQLVLVGLAQSGRDTPHTHLVCSSYAPHMHVVCIPHLSYAHLARISCASHPTGAPYVHSTPLIPQRPADGILHISCRIPYRECSLDRLPEQNDKAQNGRRGSMKPDSRKTITSAEEGWRLQAVARLQASASTLEASEPSQN